MERGVIALHTRAILTENLTIDLQTSSYVSNEIPYYCVTITSLCNSNCADDDNRIALEPLPELGKGCGDYINASYVDVRSVRLS